MKEVALGGSWPRICEFVGSQNGEKLSPRSEVKRKMRVLRMTQNIKYDLICSLTLSIGSSVLLASPFVS